MFSADPHRRGDVPGVMPSVPTSMATGLQPAMLQMQMPMAVGPGKSFECTEPGCNKRAQRSTSGQQVYCCQHMREKGLKPMESRRQCAHSDPSGKPCLKQVQRSHDGKYTHCREHMKLYGLKPANRAVCRFPGCKKRVNREKKLCDLHTNPQIQRAMLDGTLVANDEDGGSGNTDSDTDAEKPRVDMLGLVGTPSMARNMLMTGMEPGPMVGMPHSQQGFTTPGKVGGVQHPQVSNVPGANPHVQRAQVLEAKVSLLEGQLKQQGQQIEQLSKFIQQQQMLIERQNAMLSTQSKQVEQQAKMIEQQQELLGQPKMQVTGPTDPNGGGVVHDMSQGPMSNAMSMSMQLHHPMYQERHDPSSALGVGVGPGGHEVHQQAGVQQLVPDQAM